MLKYVIKGPLFLGNISPARFEKYSEIPSKIVFLAIWSSHKYVKKNLDDIFVLKMGKKLSSKWPFFSKLFEKALFC